MFQLHNMTYDHLVISLQYRAAFCTPTAIDISQIDIAQE
jgi:hypothetical protein